MRTALKILDVAGLACGLAVLFLCIAGPARASGGMPGDRAFYDSLQRLMDRHGTSPESWPQDEDRRVVAEYLRNIHGLEVGDVDFCRNVLGMGLGVSPEEAAAEQGEPDAWGVPYDRVLASSRTEPGKLDLLLGIAINQGMALFNPELARRPVVCLKLDLHSQFGDIFTQFNGVSIRIIAREVNFLGVPGSGSENFPNLIRPALTAADALRATIYTCRQDKVPWIIPQAFRDLALSFGVELPEPPAARRPMGPMKQVDVRRVQLDQCDHDLRGYLKGMRIKGDTMLRTRGI